jgi:hypothetical protein
LKDGGVVKFCDVVVGGQGFGCGFAVNAAEAAAGLGGFVVDGFAKFEKAKPQAFAELRQLFCAEQDDEQGEDENDFSAAEAEQSKEGLHDRNILTDGKISITEGEFNRRERRGRREGGEEEFFWNWEIG